MSLKEKLTGIFKKKEEPIRLVGIKQELLERTQGVKEPRVQVRAEPRLVDTPWPWERAAPAPEVKPEIKPEIKPKAPVAVVEPHIPIIPHKPPETKAPEALDRKQKPERPPTKKEPKAVVEVIQEKIKKIEQKRLTYEEEVEKYEMEQMQFQRGPDKSEAPKSEVKNVVWYKIMHSYVPWQFRNYTANKNRMKFLITCGIFKYEFITMVKSREEGKKLMDDLNKGLDYDSIMEIIPLKYGSTEKIAIYARKRTEHQGRYTGSPLHPRLLERV